jgi:hypothetical protein
MWGAGDRKLGGLQRRGFCFLRLKKLIDTLFLPHMKELILIKGKPRTGQFSLLWYNENRKKVYTQDIERVV